MPRTARRKRSLSSEEDIAITYYSKHRCVDKEYSSVSDNRHFKRYSSRSRSRERRRHNRRCSRNRSHSARRSDRKSRRLKHRHDHSTVSTVRDEIPRLSKFPNNVQNICIDRIVVQSQAKWITTVQNPSQNLIPEFK